MLTSLENSDVTRLEDNTATFFSAPAKPRPGYRELKMVDRFRIHWDRINNQELLDICDFVLQKLEHRNCKLVVEKKNLKNRVKTMETEMNEVKEALEVEKFKCAYLKEKLKARKSEDREFQVKADRLFKDIQALHSELLGERLRNALLEERINQATRGQKRPLKSFYRGLCKAIGRVRNSVRRRRNTVEDE